MFLDDVTIGVMVNAADQKRKEEQRRKLAWIVGTGLAVYFAWKFGRS